MTTAYLPWQEESTSSIRHSNIIKLVVWSGLRLPGTPTKHPVRSLRLQL